MAHSSPARSAVGGRNNPYHRSRRVLRLQNQKGSRPAASAERALCPPGGIRLRWLALRCSFPPRQPPLPSQDLRGHAEAVHDSSYCASERRRTSLAGAGCRKRHGGQKMHIGTWVLRWCKLGCCCSLKVMAAQ
ncbi:hypothetical protein J8V57_19945 [Xenorhabdus sp. PB61.4]|uniref:hypothetical protein n=1 Tax=Xenorhabdus sp. PB61.4 TaxID=2788940 RepID=UPI001E5DDC00|nr:hypothetical protein [Xenorhabdus sp. PB61.4]MCC8368457.1 hypothetical protein [Xenorhabdus sp. PB61.4]